MFEEAGEHDEMLFNVSERRARRIAASTGRYTEVFVDDGDSARIVGIQDTTAVEEWCKEQRKHAPDFRSSRNKIPAKKLHVARMPSELMTKEFGSPRWKALPKKEYEAFLMLCMEKYQAFNTQKPRTLGL